MLCCTVVCSECTIAMEVGMYVCVDELLVESALCSMNNLLDHTAGELWCGVV